MQHELLERHAALRDDEQPPCLAPGDEGLFHGAASCDQLLVVRRRDPLGGGGRASRRVALPGALETARATEGRKADGTRMRLIRRAGHAGVGIVARRVAETRYVCCVGVPGRLIGAGLPFGVEGWRCRCRAGCPILTLRPGPGCLVPRPGRCVSPRLGRGCRARRPAVRRRPRAAVDISGPRRAAVPGPRRTSRARATIVRAGAIAPVRAAVVAAGPGAAIRAAVVAAGARAAIVAAGPGRGRSRRGAGRDPGRDPGRARSRRGAGRGRSRRAGGRDRSPGPDRGRGRAGAVGHGRDRHSGRPAGPAPRGGDPDADRRDRHPEACRHRRGFARHRRGAARHRRGAAHRSAGRPDLRRGSRIRDVWRRDRRVGCPVPRCAARVAGCRLDEGHRRAGVSPP